MIDVKVRRSLLRGAAVLLAALALVPVRVPAAEPHTVLVFAAASLTNALQDIDKAFTESTKIPVKESFASSSVLAKQIEAGAPAEVFLSADEQWMDYVEKPQLVVAGTRKDLLGNSLVIVAPADSTLKLDVGPSLDLPKLLAGGRLAMGEPSSVPAGIYGRQALEKLGLWAGVSDHVAGAESVRAALALVARGEAPLGVVYSTDAAAEKQVKIVGTFPEDSHPPIHYPIGLLKGSGKEAKKLYEFLQKPAAKKIFESHGFEILK